MLGISFEDIKTIGSIGGLISAGFLLWDRFIKQRPDVAIEPEKYSKSSDAYARLSIANRSDVSVWITNIAVYPRQMRVAKDNSLDGIIHAAADMPLEIVVPAGVTQMLPILGLSDSRRPALMVVRWRISRRPSLLQVPIIRLIIPRTVKRMMDAA